MRFGAQVFVPSKVTQYHLEFLFEGHDNYRIEIAPYRSLAQFSLASAIMWPGSVAPNFGQVKHG
jgi:hypothetical protein